jgi:hypothetical protein
MNSVGKIPIAGGLAWWIDVVSSASLCWRERGYRAFQRANPGDIPVRRRKWRAR